MNIAQPPNLADLPQELKTWLASVFLALTETKASGTTASRPVNGVTVGQRYFDTTLNKPIWCSAIGPIVWRDATGAIV